MIIGWYQLFGNKSNHSYTQLIIIAQFVCRLPENKNQCVSVTVKWALYTAFTYRRVFFHKAQHEWCHAIKKRLALQFWAVAFWIFHTFYLFSVTQTQWKFRWLQYATLIEDTTKIMHPICTGQQKSVIKSVAQHHYFCWLYSLYINSYSFCWTALACVFNLLWL